MDENIKYIIGQTGVTEKEALDSFNIDNDVVNSILRILAPENKELQEKKKFSVEIKPSSKHQKKIAELRDILSDKDTLFQKIQDEKKQSEKKQSEEKNIKEI